MIPRETLATALVPGGEQLRLVRRGQDHIIMLDRNELMSSRMSGSEEALAHMGCQRIAGRKQPHVLVGGYGMGFTLRACLAVLGRDARVTVAEIVPEIIDWAKGPMAELTAGGIDDPRTTIHIGDVGALIAASPGTFDAILLDVDNGPDGLSRQGNDALYSHAGLARARMALRPGGTLAVWSAAPDKAFARRFAESGYAVEEVEVRARSNGKGPRHIIWFGRRG